MNFWQNADYVTLHTIGPNDRSWPEPVRSLSDRLEEPLPRWVYQGPHPCVAPFARSLSAELLQRRSLLSGTTDSECYDAPDDDLSRLFDAAISATATARSLLLAESERPCASNSKEFLLAGLVSHVVTLTAPQALVLERPSFVLPRHPKTLWNPLRKYMKTTSTATLLVGCIPEGFRARLGEGEEGETTTSGVDESPCDLREDPPRRMTMEEFINGRYYDDESESDSSDGGSGDKTSCVPDEAPMNDSDEKDEDPFLALHMLATPSPWDTPVIPAICMAGPGEIYALMASTLYQRRVWRVQEPLIGLMFPPTGTAAQLIFGWLEDDESIEDALPSVHLAFQDATLNASAQTVFDICDPGSTLKLCLLLSNLTRTYIDHLRQTASDSLDGVLEGAKKGHSLRWRLDLTRDESEDYVWSSTEEGIAAWAHEVSILTQVTKDASTASSNMSGAKRPAASKPSSVPSLIVSEDDSTKSKAGAGPKAGTGPTAAPASAGETGKKRLSCSEFAAKDTNRKVEDAQTLVWLADRLALCSIFPMSPPMSKNMTTGLTNEDPAIEQYEMLTSYYWPAGGFASADFDGISSELIPLKDELLAMNETYIQHAKHNLVPHTKPLPDEEVRIMKDKISIILRACFDARQRRKDAEVRKVIELEVRHEWDTLYFQFMRAREHGVWTFLDRQINLPRNKALDYHVAGKTFAFKEAILDAGKREAKSINQIEQNLKKPINTRAVQPFYHEAADKEKEQQSRVIVAASSQVLKSTVAQQIPEERITPLENCSDVEPLTGRCDAVATLYCPDFFAQPRKSPKQAFIKDFMLVDSSGTRSRPAASSGPASVSEGSASSRSDSLQVSSTTQLGDSAHSQRTRQSPRLAESRRHEEASDFKTGVLLLTRDVSAYTLPSESKGKHDVVEEATGRLEKLGLENTSKAPKTSMQTSIPSEASFESPRSLDIPLLLIEYKKLSHHDDNLVTQGVNQGRIYSLAAVEFFATLGIHDVPILTLVTEGSIGVVTCAYSKKQVGEDPLQHVRILEGNARSFDISTPLGAFHYATFLCLTARRYAPELKNKLEAVKDAFLEKYDKNDKSLRWSMRHQIEELEKGKGKAA